MTQECSDLPRLRPDPAFPLKAPRVTSVVDGATGPYKDANESMTNDPSSRTAVTLLQEGEDDLEHTGTCFWRQRTHDDDDDGKKFTAGTVQYCQVIVLRLVYDIRFSIQPVFVQNLMSSRDERHDR